MPNLNFRNSSCGINRKCFSILEFFTFFPTASTAAALSNKCKEKGYICSKIGCSENIVKCHVKPKHKERKF